MEEQTEEHQQHLRLYFKALNAPIKQGVQKISLDSVV